MAGIPKEHDGLYFDTLCRTQKAETVLSLILATDHAWRKTNVPSEVKQEIASRLVGAYNLMKDAPRRNQTGAGTYTGTASQFESQYTIGHEMCIWKGRNLELTKLAKEVANYNITIKKYFDIFFLNYFQPVNGKVIHPLFLVLTYLKINGVYSLNNEELKTALGIPCSDEDARSLINFFIGTSYFEVDDEKRLTYVGQESLDSLLEKCNKRYLVDNGLELARSELDTDEKYEEYIHTLPQQNVVRNIDDEEIQDVSNESLFRDYITNIKGHKANYVRNVLAFINRFKKRDGIDIYQIYTVDKLDSVAEKLLKDPYYVERDTHNEVSATLNKYREFLLYTYGGRVVRKTADVTTNKGHKKREGKINDLNIILYGPPGTGKTYSTPELALACIENRKPRLTDLSVSERNNVKKQYDKLVADGQIVFTTFHQNYGYEDFIEGLKPTTVDGNVSFNVEKGVFVKIANDALEHPDKEFVIIIDEINRGNISRIFGELITLIEEDKRFGEDNFIQVTLPFGDSFCVPNNLYIIGTMNSADKSISLIDAALRRRFSFISMEPNPSLVGSELREIFKNLNEHLRNELGSSDLLIGHSYFIGKKISDVENIFNKNVIPLLYEYFYDDERKVHAALKCLDEVCDIWDPSFGRLFVKRKAQ